MRGEQFRLILSRLLILYSQHSTALNILSGNKLRFVKEMSVNLLFRKLAAGNLTEICLSESSLSTIKKQLLQLNFLKDTIIEYSSIKMKLYVAQENELRRKYFS